jgi:hypothetical protein
MIRVSNITIDCADPERVAAFWVAALGYEKDGANQQWVQLKHPNAANPPLSFQRVPEPKLVKNRVHIDLTTDDKYAAVEFLISLGATIVHADVGPTRWFVIADPEGNEFCIGDGGASLRREGSDVATGC